MKATTLIRLLALSAILAASTVATAQEPAKAPSPGMEAIERFVYPPDFVVRHADEIGLSTTQRGTIRKLTLDTQSTVAALQWDLNEAFQDLLGALEPASGASQAAIIEQLEQVLGFESGVKVAHLKLVLAIREVLTPEQRAMLDARRRPKGPLHPRPAPRPGP